MPHSPQNSRSCPRLAAFTLMELLVAIAINASLVGLRLPAPSHAKARARTTKFLSYFCQLDLALLASATESSDAIPRDGTDTSGNLVFVDGHTASFRRACGTNGTGAAREKSHPDFISNPKSE